jgi:hypothetical protein
VNSFAYKVKNAKVVEDDDAVAAAKSLKKELAFQEASKKENERLSTGYYANM